MGRNRNFVGVSVLVALSLFLAPNLLLAATQAACVPPPPGLISWWPGNGNAKDIVGGENGILDAGAKTARGLVGGAFSLNGVSASVPTPLILPLVGTIECWVKFGSPPPSSTGDVWPIGGTHGTAGGADRLWIVAFGPSGYGPNVPPNTLAVNLGTTATNDISIPNPLVEGSWKHIAVTFDYDSYEYQLYIDGVLRAAVSTTTARPVPTEPFRIGGVSSDFYQFFYFPGLIDEVSIYDRVLSAPEIEDIYTAGSAGKCKFRR